MLLNGKPLRENHRPTRDVQNKVNMPAVGSAGHPGENSLEIIAFHSAIGIYVQDNAIVFSKQLIASDGLIHTRLSCQTYTPS